MDPTSDFSKLIAAAQQGDDRAATEIVERFGPHVRRVARIKLSSPVLRQRVDEDDICQSVFGVFFSGLREGRFNVTSVEDLQPLLAEVARKRVLKQVEKHRTAKRDVGKQADMGEAAFDPMSDESTASMKVSREELVKRFLENLTADERYVIDQRRQGKSWEELAGELKTSADALRVRISRVTKTAWGRLGIDDD